MLIVTLLFLATASTLVVLLRQRGAGWQAWVALALVAIVAWMCAFGAYALALENEVAATQGISWGAKLLIAGFAAYPFILWAIANLFERGRRL